MNNEPWIDGAVTPPKVGSVVRCRSKSGVIPQFVCEVEFSDAFWNEYYYVLEDSPRPFVPPEPPMPELLPDLDGKVPHCNKGSYAVWRVYSHHSNPDNPNYIGVSAPTERLVSLRWNATIEAVRGVKG